MTSRDDRDNTQPARPVNWRVLAIALLLIVALSFGMAHLLNSLAGHFEFTLYDLAWLAYLIVFGTSLISNLTIIAPVPFAISIMIAAATKWNPLLIILAGSIGGTLGELSGYYAGYLGRKIAISDSVIGHTRAEQWLQRYGVWAISFLALQPIIPFDIGGLVAGAARMPLPKFLPALWLGKFAKYAILTYAGIGLIHFMPF
ncbi:MAG: VTT domain-containing protein [Chloroflexota bacterium]